MPERLCLGEERCKSIQSLSVSAYRGRLHLAFLVLRRQESMFVSDCKSFHCVETCCELAQLCGGY